MKIKAVPFWFVSRCSSGLFSGAAAPGLSVPDGIAALLPAGAAAMGTIKLRVVVPKSDTGWTGDN